METVKLIDAIKSHHPEILLLGGRGNGFWSSLPYSTILLPPPIRAPAVIHDGLPPGMAIDVDSYRRLRLIVDCHAFDVFLVNGEPDHRALTMLMEWAREGGLI